MRKTIFVAVSVAMLATSGCGAVRDSLRYPGGAIGRTLDERTFDASESKQLALLRASLALAIAARIGEGSVDTADADVFARQLAEAANEINYAAVDAGFRYFPRDEEGNAKENRTRITCLVSKGLGRDTRWSDPSLTPTSVLLPNPTPSLTTSSDKSAERAPMGGATPMGRGTMVLKNESLAINRDYHAIFYPAISYDAMDLECAGFYVNFEANIARIESRIARAMLTALPTTRAREFLDRLSGGDMLSALWSLARAFGDVTSAFHRGAGAYRAGIENVAASIAVCDGKEPLAQRFKDYRQDRDSVKAAAACLGLSERDLFDGDDIAAKDLPNQVDPLAFLALFRIARTSCVALPLLNSPNDDIEFIKNRDARRESCNLVRFDPKPRADAIKKADNDDSESAGEEGKLPPAQLSPTLAAPITEPSASPAPDPVRQSLPTVSAPPG